VSKSENVNIKINKYTRQLKDDIQKWQDYTKTYAIGHVQEGQASPSPQASPAIMSPTLNNERSCRETCSNIFYKVFCICYECNWNIADDKKPYGVNIEFII